MLVLLFVNFLWAADCQHERLRFNCVQFIKAVDGDTIQVSLPGVHAYFGEKAKIRLMGIDTPETHGKGPCEKEWARVAKNLVQSQLRDTKRIDLKLEPRPDKYGRPLAHVLYDGKDMGEILLKNHLAVPYLGGKKSQVNWCQLRDLAKKGPRA